MPPNGTRTAAAAQSEDDDAFFSRDDSFNSGSTGHRRDDGSRSNSSHASSRDGSRRASLQELSVLRAAGDAQPPLLSPTAHRDRRSSAASVLTEWSDGGSGGGAAWPPSPAGSGSEGKGAAGLGKGASAFAVMSSVPLSKGTGKHGSVSLGGSESA